MENMEKDVLASVNIPGQDEGLLARIAELKKEIQALRTENSILKAKTEIALKLMFLALDFQAISNAHSKEEAK
jgi:hypothetical protein